MHIGLSSPAQAAYPEADLDAALVARVAEELGFEALFYGEHPVTPAGEAGFGPYAAVPYFQDTLVALARASGATTRLTLGSGVFLLPLHQPVMFAKQLASLDFYSGGRLVVGAGFGWSRGECQAMGVDFERRFASGLEAIRVMKALWTQDAVEFRGEFFDVPPITIFPKPAQTGGPPILLPGGPLNFHEPWDSPKLVPRFRRIVNYADGWIPAMMGAEEIRNGPQRLAEGRRLLAQLCAEVGRNVDELQTTAHLRTETGQEDDFPQLPDRDTLRRYEDLGVERALVKPPTLRDEAHAREVLARMAEAVL